MSRIIKATNEFLVPGAPVAFTVCAWGLENAYVDGDPAYEGGGTLNVNPRRLLLEPDIVADRIHDLQPTWPRKAIEKAVATAKQQLLATAITKSDALRTTLSLGEETMQVPKDSNGAQDFAVVHGITVGAVHEKLLAHAFCRLADQVMRIAV